MSCCGHHKYIHDFCIPFFLVPAPTAVTVMPPVDAVIAGSSFDLTCAVELSPAVDVTVTVNTEWTGPGGVMFMPTNPVPAVMVNTTTYSSTVTVDAARNGSYTCQATVTSGGTTSGSTDITVGMCLIAFLYHKHKMYTLPECIQSLQPPSLLPLS